MPIASPPDPHRDRPGRKRYDTYRMVMVMAAIAAFLGLLFWVMW